MVLASVQHHSAMEPPLVNGQLHPIDVSITKFTLSLTTVERISTIRIMNFKPSPPKERSLSKMPKRTQSPMTMNV